MKLKICMLLLPGGMLTASPNYSQQIKLDVSYEKESLVFVLNDLKTKTDYQFVYFKESLPENLTVTVTRKDATIVQLLDEILVKNGLNYSIHGDVISISRSDAPAARLQTPTVIQGVVRDNDGRPLAGATVSVRGTTNRVATDANGRFTIGVPGSEQSAVIVVSFLGKVSVEVEYTGQPNIMVTMQEDRRSIDEVVVTGYQRIERRSLTSSITTVDMERLEFVNQPNIDRLLQGQVAGMTVINSSGAPGSVPQIQIRGASSFSGNTQPLWVVDGIIIDDPVNLTMAEILGNTNLISSAIGGVNVDDIMSINILKDAAATALYGTRAANGVIVITTKRGQVGKARVQYNGSIFMNMRPRIGDAYMMNSLERIDVNLEMIRNGTFLATSSGAGKYGNASDFERYYLDAVDRNITWAEFENKVHELEAVNTDWFKHVFRNAITHRHNIDISGGTEMATYFISGSVMDDQATAKGVGQRTYTGTIRSVVNMRDNLRLDAKINVSARDNTSFFSVDSWENPYEWAIYTTPAHRAYDENGEYNYMYYNDLKYNFLENRKTQWRESSNFSFTANAMLEWNIMPELQFRSTFSINKQNTKETDIATDDSYYVQRRKIDFYVLDGYTSVPIWFDGGWRQDETTNARSMTFGNQLSWMPVFDANNRMDMIAGMEIKKSQTDAIRNEVYGYAHNLGHQMIPQWDMIETAGRGYWSENTFERASISYYGMAGYTFMDRYTVSFNGRIDLSNGFGLKTNKVFNPVWAIGANYQIKQENFLRDVLWLDYLTLRASYGTQGNLSSKAFSDVVAYFSKADGINKDIPLLIRDPKNPGLKWERVKTINGALEFSVFNRRISAIVEMYTKKTTDALANKAVSQVTGFSSMTMNWASLRNHGTELTINTINVSNPDFRWTTNLTLGYNENKVLAFEGSPSYTSLTNAQRYDPSSAVVIGKSLDALWSFQYAGLNEEGRAQFYNQDGELVTTGMSKIEGLVYSGVMTPRIQGGLTNTITYKGLTAQVLLVGSFGHVVRLRNLSTTSSAYGYPNPTQNMSKEWAGRWRQPGDELHTDIPRLEANIWADELSYPYPANSTMYDRSDLRTVKGDYVRLQNVSLSYEFTHEILLRAGIRNVRVMLQGNNLHVWKNKALKGQDPEATGQMKYYSATNSATSQVSFGNTFLPLPRSYSFSMYLQF